MLRTQFLKKVEARLEELGREIDKIKARAETAEAAAKAKYQEQIEILRSKQDAARKQLGKVRDAGSASWGHLKGGAEKAYDELKKAVDTAIETLKKIA